MPADRRLRQDRRAVAGHVYDPAPLAQHLETAEHRERLDQRAHRLLDVVEAAALGVGVVAVGAAADHHLALVGLAHVAMDGVGHHDHVHAGLDRLGDAAPAAARSRSAGGIPPCRPARPNGRRRQGRDCRSRWRRASSRRLHAPAFRCGRRSPRSARRCACPCRSTPAHSPRPPRRAARCRRATARARPAPDSAAPRPR